VEARSEAAPAPLGFVVEGEDDRQVVKCTTAVMAERRGLGPVHVPAIGLHGAPPEHLAASIARDLFNYGCHKVLVLLDAGNTDQRKLEDRRLRLGSHLLRDCPQHGIPVLFAVPELEAWLLADDEGLTNAYGPKPTDAPTDPKELLQRWTGGAEPNDILPHLDLDRMRAGNASFDEFCRAVEAALVAATEASSAAT
jgi:hypothetical protein